MKLNSFCANPAFKCDFVYKGKYFSNKQDCTHDVIRAHLEEQAGASFYYSDQLEKEKMPGNIYFSYASPSIKRVEKNEKTKKVDTDLLQKLKISAYRERRKNELYSGAELSYDKEKLEGLKKAGIESVLCLADPLNYKERCLETGLNYKSLGDLGGKLNIFDINGDLIHDLIKNPESFAQDDENSKISGLKLFIKTLNGKNPDLPLPLYFGCHHGTDRTVMWYQLYEILKDVPFDEPLSDEKVQELAQFAQDVDSYFRW